MGINLILLALCVIRMELDSATCGDPRAVDCHAWCTHRVSMVRRRDPVDDLWYPEWKTFDAGGRFDDGIVRITVMWTTTVSVCTTYYDATDLHGNDAVQQVRTIILDRTFPEMVVHRRWPTADRRNVRRPDKNYDYNGLTSQPCPARTHVTLMTPSILARSMPAALRSRLKWAPTMLTWCTATVNESAKSDERCCRRASGHCTC